ncbi:MAG: tripartite tricarboxylate transporter substrate binding protein [Pseudomonadota bacterium]|nr:tripartite tricarboxylate transporter substrate binding protein [Pseudomonadota bacterium]
MVIGKITRKLFLTALALSALSVLPARAQSPESADNYPSRPIRLILGHSPGGNADTFARALARPLSERLGQPITIENRAGANQIIAAETAARAVPDGYTLYLASQTSLVLNVGAHKKLPYDPVRDFAPVSLVYTVPLYLVVNPSVPATNVKELIALAKARPGKLNFASIGIGSSVQLAGEMFKSMAGIDIVHVPYKGSVEAEVDLMAGRVQMMFDGGVSALPQAKNGKVRVLAMTGTERSPSFPNIPTMIESGLPGYSALFWFGIVAPAGTPEPIVNKLSHEIGAILNDPVFKKVFQQQGVDPVSSTPAEFSRLIQTDLPKWTGIMKQAGITPN